MAFTEKQLKQLKANLNKKKPKGKQGAAPIRKYKHDPQKSIWLPGQVRSLKNSKNIIPLQDKTGNYTGKFNVKPSDNCLAYLVKLAYLVIENKPNWDMLVAGLKPPYHVLFKFVVENKIRRDYGNMHEVILDAITGQAYEVEGRLPKGMPRAYFMKHTWIPDDDYKFIVPYFAPIGFDKHNPGTIITPLRKPPAYGFKVW